MLSREQILADIDRGYFTTPLEWSEDISQADKNNPKFRKDILDLFEKKIKQYFNSPVIGPMAGSVLGRVISAGVSALSEDENKYDVRNFLYNNAALILHHVVRPYTEKTSKEDQLLMIKKAMGQDFDMFIKNAAEQIGRRPEGMKDIVSFLKRSDEFHPEWKEDVLRPMMKYFIENADPDHLPVAIKLNQKHPTPELEQFIEDEIDDNTKRDPYYYLSNISFNSLPERLQHKYIDGYLNENNIYDTVTRQDIPYEKFKSNIDRAISDLLDRDSLDPIIHSPNPSYLSGNVKKILNHPEAKRMVGSLREHGNTDSELAKRKAELAYEVFQENGIVSDFLNLTPDHQQDILKKIIRTGAVKNLPTDHDSLELVADHLDSFDQSEKSQLGDWLRRFHERHGDRLKSAMEHELSDEQKEKITPFAEEHIPQFALQAPAKFWYEYEQKVRPHHFAVGKSLHTNVPETLTDHRGDTGSSDYHMHLLPNLRKYAQATQKKIQDAVDQGILKAKTIDGKPHLWLYRGIAGHFAKSLRDLVGSGQLDPDDQAVVHHRDVEYPASPIESWSTSLSVAQDFADREIKGHPSRQGVVMASWVPVDSIIHSGFISVYPNQPHAHERENEFVAHIASDKPTRTVHSKDFMIDDNSQLGYDSYYLPTKTIKQPEEMKATQVEKPPTESPMSKAEKPMDQKPNAHEILSVLHGEARKNKAQDSQQTIVDQNAQIKQRIHAVASKIKEVAPQLEQLKTTHPEAFSTLMESIKAMMTMAKQYVPQEAHKPTEPMQKARIEVRHPPGVRSPSMITGASADAKPTHRSGKIFTMEPDQTGEVKKKKREARSGLIMNPATGAAVSVRQAPHEQKHPDAVKVT